MKRPHKPRSRVARILATCAIGAMAVGGALAAPPPDDQQAAEAGAAGGRLPSPLPRVEAALGAATATATSAERTGGGSPPRLKGQIESIFDDRRRSLGGGESADPTSSLVRTLGTLKQQRAAVRHGKKKVMKKKRKKKNNNRNNKPNQNSGNNKKKNVVKKAAKKKKTTMKKASGQGNKKKKTNTNGEKRQGTKMKIRYGERGHNHRGRGGSNNAGRNNGGGRNNRNNRKKNHQRARHWAVEYGKPGTYEYVGKPNSKPSGSGSSWSGSGSEGLGSKASKSTKAGVAGASADDDYNYSANGASGAHDDDGGWSSPQNDDPNWIPIFDTDDQFDDEGCPCTYIDAPTQPATSAWNSPWGSGSSHSSWWGAAATTPPMWGSSWGAAAGSSSWGAAAGSSSWSANAWHPATWGGGTAGGSRRKKRRLSSTGGKPDGDGSSPPQAQRRDQQATPSWGGTWSAGAKPVKGANTVKIKICTCMPTYMPTYEPVSSISFVRTNELCPRPRESDLTIGFSFPLFQTEFPTTQNPT